MSSKDLIGDSGPQSAAKAILDGYNQTYIIMRQNPNDGDSKSTSMNEDGHEVLFRCGNWCYHGRVQFGDLQLTIAHVPVVIPTLQKQQGQLRYYCNASSIPPDSKFASPVDYLNAAAVFFASEMSSPSIEREMRDLSETYSWIDDDSSSTYFELSLANLPDYMEGISLIASKTYALGLIVIAIYFERSIYFVLNAGEGDQPLLDIRFPDLSQHGQGVALGSYDGRQYASLSLWHVLNTRPISIPELPKLKTLSLSTNEYEQTYCIMKSAWDPELGRPSVHRDALFRFGSWCYAGRVQLVSEISLSDVPFVIPALRVQQSRMDYFCDASAMPTTSPFAPVLKYMHQISPVIASQIHDSEEILNSLVLRLSNIGLTESVKNWLEGDASLSFFEFKVVADAEFNRSFEGIDLVVSKSYHASGIITITIVFKDTFYICLQDGSNENPLLDSKFPDVSGKGRGYQLCHYEDGIKEWPILRKVTIWQTMSSLEQEFRNKISKISQTKVEESAARNRLEEEDIITEDAKKQPERENATSRSVNEEDEIEIRTAVSLQAESKDANDDYSKKSPVVSSSQDASFTSPASRSLAPINSGGRPHHIPKNESLSKRLDELRKNLGDEGLQAPWDAKGKPLGKIEAKK